MNLNISVYRRLKPKLLVLVQVGISLAYYIWVNISNIFLTMLKLILNLYFGTCNTVNEVGSLD